MTSYSSHDSEIKNYVHERRHVSNARFLVMAYEEIMGRGLDEGGFSAWLTELNAGFDRAQMVTEFLNSPEFQAKQGNVTEPENALNGMRFVGVNSSALALPSFPGLVTSQGERVDAETYPPRATLEQYQDIWVKGKPQKRGVRECADRFELIADFCRQFNRPFTVLDLGANLGYFSLRLTECFDCTAVACEGIYGEWLKEILVQNANPRVILLQQIFTLADLKALAQVEHFDVILGLSVIHHLDGAFDESLEVLRSLGDHLILELPFEANACGQKVVQQAVETKLPEDAIFMGFGQSHLAEGKRQIVRLSRPKSRIEKSYLGTPRTGLDVTITSDFDKKHIQFHNKPEARPWEHGINLQTYLWFHGSFPPRTHIAELAQNIALEGIPHRDIQPWNIILQGDSAQLIDHDDPLHALNLDDNTCRDRLVNLLKAGEQASDKCRLTSLRFPLRWRGPIFNPSGYASEAINFILPLAKRVEQLGIFHDTALYSEKFVAGLPEADRKCLLRLRHQYPSVKGGIVIWHNPANGFGRLPDAVRNIGRTMFETDRIPQPWVAKCNAMDEVWVPSQFNVETFANSGVERSKLRVMPEAVDEKIFNPERHTALPLPNRARFNFLSIFEWSARKGWDVLLSAYLREFSANDDVCLYLRTYLFSQPDGDPSQAIWGLIREHAATLNLGDKRWPRIELLAEQIATEDLPRLYKSVDCLVAPSRGEGWGRPHHEAMLMGLPVIATNWSGNTEFMKPENSYLIDYEMVDVKGVGPELAHYRGHRWANPSEEHLRKLMRQVHQNPDEARQRGARARADMLAQFIPDKVAEKVIARLRQIERTVMAPSHPSAQAATKPSVMPANTQSARQQIRVTWRGSFHNHGSLAHVNREFTACLEKTPHLRLNCIASDNSKNITSATVSEITVHHSWPPNWTQPESGAWIVIQPWEFGALPKEWVQQFRKVDEAWVPSEYVRRVYVESGVDPAKVKVVPNGVNSATFNPQAKPIHLATKKKFKFLFVGGTIARKGPDVLLKAYLDHFTAADDVCLVIKDFGGKTVYRGQTFSEEIKAAQKRPNAPEILYLDQDLSPEQLPGIYTACDCLVHPYRGEGFGLPVLEAMACGLPVIVTAGGATDDFATDEFVERIAAHKQSIGNTVAGIPLVHNGWWLEPPATLVGARMHWVFHHRDEARAKAKRASEYVRQEWTWERAAQIALSRMQDLAACKHAEQEAIKQRRARQMAPIQMPAAGKLGNLRAARDFHAAGKFTDAANAANKAIQQRPFHPEAYLLLAEIAKAQNKFDQARDYASQARQMAPNWKPAKEFLKALPGRVSNVKSKENSLSVCLIVKNEERFLAQCLRSVRPLASQIVVVDTGSTDRTVEIAKEFGAEVHSFTWCNDFSAARNAALEHATGDWILVIDADEELPSASLDILKKDMHDSEAMAYRLQIIDKGREDEGHSYVPRFFRNAPGLFFVGRVHEQAFSSVEVRRREWGLDNRLSKAVILHHGYDAQLQRDRNKNARNLNLLEMAIEEMPNEPHLLMQYGMELARSGQVDTALENYWEAVHILAGRPAHEVIPELRETLLTQLATHLLSAKDYAEIQKLFQTPLAKSAALTASMHFVIGLAEMEQGRFASAADQMRHVLAKRNENCLSPIHKDIRKGGPNHCLGICYKMLKQPEKALKAFQQAVAEDPQSRPVRYDYARFLTEQGHHVDALKSLYASVQVDSGDTGAWILGAQVALSCAELLEFAGDWTAEAVKHCPDCQSLQLLRGETLILRQDIDGARQILRRAEIEGNWKYLAGLVLCEILADGEAEVPTDAEGNISREFLQWYRQLLRVNATELIKGLNNRLESLRKVLPGAAQVLEQALLEADAEAVAA